MVGRRTLDSRIDRSLIAESQPLPLPRNPPGRIRVGILLRARVHHLRALVEAARGGDVQAAWLLLERVVPTLKPIEMTSPLALAGESLTARGTAVLEAVADGHLAPSQAAQLLTAIGTLARVVEVDELTARVAALEERSG